jgi:phosphohistidine phosphatase SixA
MRLVLARHGRAGDAPIDADRRLTDTGRDGVTKVGRKLSTLGVTGAAVYSSPYLRALETAAILSQETASGAVTTVPALESGAPLDELIRIVGSHSRRPLVVLVGHMPDLGVLAAWLAWGTRSRVIEMPVGAAVQFTVETLHPEPKAIMDWMITPQDL